MKKYLIVSIAIMYCFIATGQNVNDTISKGALKSNEGTNYFGINGGTSTGLGFSYINWPGKNGFQITFLPIINKDHTYFSLGGTYLRKLKEFKKTTFFFYWGNHLSNLFSPDNSVELSTGIGPGVEYYIDDFVCHVMIGYAIYAIPDNMAVLPAIEVGIFYKF
jgi:hypothetical protein